MDDHVDVTINDQTKVSLGWVFAGAGFLITSVASLVFWGSSVSNSVAETSSEVTSVKADIKSIKDSVEKMKEAQIRMETRMGIAASYSKDSEGK